ncbi:MAG: serine/threonine protein kinase [Planctomycetes bacterium]|nr:serine/threonine protein kinase [Planctomycetota bacterium]
MKLHQLGPYRIVKKIGKGGMGAVYEAVCDGTGPNPGERVAIKALSPQLAMAEGFRERFEAEIESLKILEHAGIVRLYGYGEQDGMLFYSMEIVDGPSLEEELHDGRRFDWRETLQIGIQICRALKHAHDHGVVHRDIKPANIMLAAENRIKIADFGIARLFGGTQLTTAGGVLGTADYMSPEQADGRTVTEKCDQYSLGGVMYALLAGRPPFKAKTMPEMLQLQRFAEPEPVRRYAVDTPDQLDRLISQLLAKEPSERFPNVLVLSRHMEAMEKALSRPVKGETEDEISTTDFARPSSSNAATINEDATLAFDAPIILPHETSQGPPHPDLYDAPTLAQPLEPASDVPPSSGTKAASLLEQKPTFIDDEPAKKTSHFTTVDEDARRLREQSRSNPLVLASQLGGLLITLGFLMWGGWQLMRPPTADELYSKLYQVIETEDLNNLSREDASDVESFFTRFPDDPRAKELQPLREQLQFQKYERQARNRSRFAGTSGLKPVERIYFEALAVAKDDPARALSKLRALLALYDPTEKVIDFESAKALSKQFEELGDARLLVTARQRVEKLRGQLQESASTQLPALRERLAAAAKLRQTDPARANRMYQAIIRLYQDQAWAHNAVSQAKKEMTSNE